MSRKENTAPTLLSLPIPKCQQEPDLFEDLRLLLGKTKQQQQQQKQPQKQKTKTWCKRQGGL